MKLPQEATRWAILAAALLWATTGLAATEEGEEANPPAAWSLSGFGSLGAVTTDSSQAHFHRDGQAARQSGPRVDLEADSNAGLQLDLRPLPGLHGMLQAVALRRLQQHADASVTWAALDWQGPASTVWRIGRTVLPLFADSDFRHVGYASTWLRPPAEVYGLALINTLQGVDLQWQGEGVLEALRVTALGGDGQLDLSSNSHPVRQLRGLALAWAPAAGLSLGASRVQGHVQLPGENPDLYRFSSLKAQWLHPRGLLKAEYVVRNSSTHPELVGARGWYTMAGLRQGPWTFYALTASGQGDSNSAGALTGSQRTRSIGLRWDLKEGWALKLQADRISVRGAPPISFDQADAPPGASQPGSNVGPPGGTAGLPDRPVTVLGAALSFVF